MILFIFKCSLNSFNEKSNISFSFVFFHHPYKKWLKKHLYYNLLSLFFFFLLLFLCEDSNLKKEFAISILYKVSPTYYYRKKIASMKYFTILQMLAKAYGKSRYFLEIMVYFTEFELVFIVKNSF